MLFLEYLEYYHFHFRFFFKGWGWRKTKNQSKIAEAVLFSVQGTTRSSVTWSTYDLYVLCNPRSCLLACVWEGDKSAQIDAPGAGRKSPAHTTRHQQLRYSPIFYVLELYCTLREAYGEESRHIKNKISKLKTTAKLRLTVDSPCFLRRHHRLMVVNG